MIRRDDRGVLFVPAGRETPRVFKDPVTCGVCGRTWDDGRTTSVTPAPAGRCPFEAWHTRPAWDLVGHEGSFRILGGRTVYEAVQYNLDTATGDRPRLTRLETEGGLHQVNRYVDPDLEIEVLADFNEGDAVYEEEVGE